MKAPEQKKLQQAEILEQIRLIKPGHRTNQSSMQKFEQLIQDTKNSDEDSLIKHIQKNLEHMNIVGDYKERFAKLKQQ